MTIAAGKFDLLAACTPGLEELLAVELGALGAGPTGIERGGVVFSGDARILVRANLRLRCADRVLVRLGSFRALHLAQLDRRARRLAWSDWLATGQPLRVRASCHRSRIYHSGAAAERVTRSACETSGAHPAGPGQPAAEVRVRLDDDLCIVSLDSSGEPLWRRGPKVEGAAAPLRESLAAAGLLWAGYDGSLALLDPMCGSGTLLLEAASLALARAPGLLRDFAFSNWPGFDPGLLESERHAARALQLGAPAAGLFGSDRSGGALGTARRNLERAGCAAFVRLEQRPLDRLEPPAVAGLWICNPPYGRRLERDGKLMDLYRQLGRVFSERFLGWRLALYTTHARLAAATGLDPRPVSPPLAHGGLQVRLYLAE